MASYVELHAHSAYSFHDGVSQPDELIGRAAELGYGTFALTDHDAVHGSMEFAHAAAALGVSSLHGTELTVAVGSGETRRLRHVTLLVESARGWRTLCRLLTLAHADTRSADAARTPQQPQVSLDELLAVVGGGAGPGGGLICLTGCHARGLVAAEIAAGRVAEAERIARLLLATFGADNLRIELQRPFQRHDRQLNRALEDLATRLRVPTVATGNVHSHSRERAALQDVFVAVRHNASLDETEPARRGNSSHVLVSPEAMAKRFAEHPRAVAETTEIADRIDFDLTADLGYRYPGAEDPEQAVRLRAVCEQRLIERYGPGAGASGSVGRRRVTLKEARVRLEEELAVIEKLRLPGFFLIHHDLLEMARDVAREVRGESTARAVLPPGRGRGSSVSSIVCYLTGLSHVDPLEAELCIGRFLHEKITSLPDIDLDFPRDIRKVLIPRIHERYGRERSALVAAFPTYRTRGSLRALGKAFALPGGEIERLLRTTDRSYGESLTERVEASIRQSPAGENLLENPRWRALLRLLPEIHRLPRGLSQHSGGMVISTDRLDEICPIVPAAMPDRQIMQWDKDSCSDAGFAKIDLLGLGMLSSVERTVDLIHGARGEMIDLSRIPLDDSETFRQIRAAETTGVFQIESRAQMQMLVRSQPQTLNEVFIQVAIVRPGPITGGAVNPYLERRKLLRLDPSYEVPYAHPLLKDVLGETLGAIVFQDQVIEVARAIADFSPSEGEGLRRAMSRKRSHEAMDAYRERFMAGAAANGVDEKTAEEIFEQIVGFSGFGFPKAHAAAFGLLAYQTSWLRAHYPVEFLCGLMNEQPMGFYLPDALAHEAQRRGLTVLPVDVDRSEVECSVEWVGGDGGGQVFDDDGPSRSSHGDGDGVGLGDDGERSVLGRDQERELHVVDGPQRMSGDDEGEVAPSVGRELAVRIGLGYVKGVKGAALRSLVAARAEGGPFTSIEDLASRSGADGATLEQLAWAGACDRIGGRQASVNRREALWLLGAAATGETKADDSAQLALPLAPLPAPKLRQLSDWDEMIADYRTTSMTVGAHPMQLLREGLSARGVRTSAELSKLPEGTQVEVAGLVVARQRPGTAKGVVFLLLEDETEVINVILPPPIYKRFRVTVRGEPLLIVRGRVERRTGALNVLAEHVAALLTEDDEAVVHQLRPKAPATPAAEIRAVAPVGINFGQRGR
jgi:error-prone DNA polymerase